MLEVFLVTLRESVEIMLLLVAVALYLPRADRGPLVRCLLVGTLAGLVAGAGLAAVFARGFSLFIDAVLTLLFGCFLAWMAAGMLSSNGRISRWARVSVELWAERLGWPLAMTVLSAVLACREAFEVGFFAQHHAGTIGAPAAVAAVVAGIVAALLLPVAGSMLGLRAQLGFAFRISALVLSYFALSMMVEGLFDVAMLSGWLGGWLGDDLPGTVGARADAGRGLLVALLMVLPLYFIARDWWVETEPAARPGRRDGPLEDKLR